jgi:hypothetical protein
MLSEGPQKLRYTLTFKPINAIFTDSATAFINRTRFILNTIKCFVLISDVILCIFNFDLFLIQGEVEAGWIN